MKNTYIKKVKILIPLFILSCVFLTSYNISFAQSEKATKKAVVKKQTIKKAATSKTKTTTPKIKKNTSKAASTTDILATKTLTSTNNFSKEVNDILNKNFSSAVWVPYWAKTKGLDEVKNNINKIDIVSPFSYEMTETGTFVDKMKLGFDPYMSSIKLAKENKKLVIPSILWWATDEKGRSDVDFVLKDSDLRSSIIFDIKTEIKKYNLDGIDIDFENKKAETRDAFSTFIEELSAELHKDGKVLICTIEARTPSDTDFVNGPDAAKDLERSNDFKRLGKACDQVRIMAYDQGSADADLNKVRAGGAYRPVADIDWVKKVLTLAMRDIEFRKIIVGVPTYGYKYEIIRDTNQNINSYKRLGSMNWIYADAEAKAKNVLPERNVGGELSYTYFDTEKNKEYLVWYSDAEAIKQKIDLAKLYKIGGVAIFKIDGNQDKNI